MSKDRGAKYNFLSTILFQLISSIVGLIIPQFVLKIYGPNIFGFSSSIMQVVQGINLLEIGLGAGLIQALYFPIHIGDNRRINGILSLTKTYYIKSGTAILGLSIFIAYFYSLVSSNNYNLKIFLPLAIILLLGGVGEYFLIGKYRVLLTADERIGVLINIQTAALIISSIIRISLMFMGVGIVLMQLIATAIYVSRFILVAYYVRSKYPTVKFDVWKDDEKVDNASVIIHNISGIMVYNTPFIILLCLTSTKTVSVYAVYALVFNAIASILTTTFSQATVATFGRITSSGDSKLLRDKYDIYEFAYIVFTFSFYITVFIMITPFVRLYTAGIESVQYVNLNIAILFTISGCLFALRAPMLTIIQAKGHFMQTRKSVIVEIILVISISYFAVINWGIIGVFAGMIISAAYRGSDLMIYGNKILGRKSWKTLYRVLLNSVFFILLILLYKDITISNSWFRFMLAGVFQGTIIFLVVLLINLIAEPRYAKMFWNMLRRNGG